MGEWVQSLIPAGDQLVHRCWVVVIGACIGACTLHGALGTGTNQGPSKGKSKATKVTQANQGHQGDTKDTPNHFSKPGGLAGSAAQRHSKPHPPEAIGRPGAHAPAKSCLRGG